MTIALMAVGCKKENEKTDPPTVIKLTVNNEYYEVPLVSGTVVDLTTMCTEFDAQIVVENANEFDRVTIAGVVGGSREFHVDSISADVQIPIEYVAGDESGTILLNTLHSGIPHFKVSGHATSKGEFYLSFVYMRLIMKCDNDGHPIYYRYEPYQPTSTSEVTGWWDFKKHIINGETYYSYHVHDPAFANRCMNGYNPGMRVIVDDHYNVVKTIHLKAADHVNEGDPLDGHDFYMFDLNHYIVSSYIDRNLNGRTVAAAYLQEVQNDKVIFDWWSTNHPEMDTMMDPVFADVSDKDYIHYNSFQILPDGNWLCSFRRISSVFKIDRVGGTGNFLWRIAGTEIREACRFHGQHYVRYDGTYLTLFDNGNGQSPQVTKLLKLKVDVETGEVSGVCNLIGGDYFTKACGALTFSGNNTIVSWGMPGNDGQSDRLVTEYNAAGDEVFGIRFSDNNFQYNSFRSSYRCVKM